MTTPQPLRAHARTQHTRRVCMSSILRSSFLACLRAVCQGKRASARWRLHLRVLTGAVCRPFRAGTDRPDERRRRRHAQQTQDESTRELEARTNGTSHDGCHGDRCGRCGAVATASRSRRSADSRHRTGQQHPRLNALCRVNRTCTVTLPHGLRVSLLSSPLVSSLLPISRLSIASAATR